MLTMLSKDELLHNIELTLTMVEQMEKANLQVERIRRKPIRLAFSLHFALVAVVTALIGGFFLLDEMGMFNKEYQWIQRDNLLYFLAIPLIGYPTIVYFSNLYVVLAKRWLYRDELQKLELRRLGMIEKLNNTSYIPADYWTVAQLTRMRKYLRNKRADSLKEVLNLLEEELRYDHLLSSFGIKQKNDEK
jgi:hypothetical protein